MNEKEFYEKMVALKNMYKNDPEALHSEMDDLMCALLKDLGYGDGVEVFNSCEIFCC